MLLKRRDYPLDGYTLLRVTGGTGRNCSHGSCLYVKKDRDAVLNPQFVADNSHDQNGMYTIESVELNLFTFDHPATFEKCYSFFNHSSSSVGNLFKHLIQFINEYLTPTAAAEDEDGIYIIIPIFDYTPMGVH